MKTDQSFSGVGHRRDFGARRETSNGHRRTPLFPVNREKAILRYVVSAFALFAVTVLIALAGFGPAAPVKRAPLPFALILLASIGATIGASAFFRRRQWL